MNTPTVSSIMDLPITYPAAERDPDQTPETDSFRDIYNIDYIPSNEWNTVRMYSFFPKLIETVMQERNCTSNEAFVMIKDDLTKIDPKAFEKLLSFVESANEFRAFYKAYMGMLFPQENVIEGDSNPKLPGA